MSFDLARTYNIIHNRDNHTEFPVITQIHLLPIYPPENDLLLTLSVHTQEGATRLIMDSGLYIPEFAEARKAKWNIGQHNVACVFNMKRSYLETHCINPPLSHDYVIVDKCDVLSGSRCYCYHTKDNTEQMILDLITYNSSHTFNALLQYHNQHLHTEYNTNHASGILCTEQLRIIHGRRLTTYAKVVEATCNEELRVSSYIRFYLAGEHGYVAYTIDLGIFPLSNMLPRASRWEYGPYACMHGGDQCHDQCARIPIHGGLYAVSFNTTIPQRINIHEPCNMLTNNPDPELDSIYRVLCEHGSIDYPFWERLYEHYYDTFEGRRE